MQILWLKSDYTDIGVISFIDFLNIAKFEWKENVKLDCSCCRGQRGSRPCVCGFTLTLTHLALLRLDGCCGALTVLPRTCLRVSLCIATDSPCPSPSQLQLSQPLTAEQLQRLQPGELGAGQPVNQWLQVSVTQSRGFARFPAV